MSVSSDDCRERPLPDGKFVDPLPLSELGEERISAICQAIRPCVRCLRRQETSRLKHSKAYSALTDACSLLQEQITSVEMSCGHYGDAHSRYKKEYFTYYAMAPAALIRDAEEEQIERVGEVVKTINKMKELVNRYTQSLNKEVEDQLDASLCESGKLYKHLICPPPVEQALSDDP